MARLWLMTLVRLVGIAIVLGGMWVVGRGPGDPGPMVAGLLLMGAGGAVSLLAPRALARRWMK